MKMKITIFPVLLLAAASLGFALPQKPSVHLPEGSANTTTQSFDVDPKLAEAVSPLGLPTDKGSPVGSLTKTCQAALLSIITDPEFLKCVPIAAALPLVPIVTDPNFVSSFLKDPKGTYQKIEQPFIQSATLLCAAPKCSKDGNDKAIKTIQDGCKDDLTNKNPIAVIIFDVAVFYSPLRDTICFTDKKTKKFCWDETLLTVVDLPPSPIKVTGNGLVDSIAVADPFAICTDCNKDVVSTFAIFLKNNQLALQVLASLGVDDKELATLQTFTAVKCGINFLDGKIPK